jgi:hypothetical protein
MVCNMLTKIYPPSVRIFGRNNSDVYHLLYKTSFRNIRPKKKKQRCDIFTLQDTMFLLTLLGCLEEAIDYHQGLEHIKIFFYKKLL